MSCQRCSSERIVHCGGNVSDMFNMTAYEVYEGYVPRGLNLGSGDYIELKVCFDCGTLQGQWPVTDVQLSVAVKS